MLDSSAAATPATGTDAANNPGDPQILRPPSGNCTCDAPTCRAKLSASAQRLMPCSTDAANIDEPADPAAAKL
jgi:hypothetical protein